MQPLPDLLRVSRPLHVGDVHLWLLDFRRFSHDQHHDALAVMNEEEHARAQKFIRGTEEYIACRWLLRRVLGHYLHQPPEALMFSRQQKGKPFIAGCDIQFNLSHSGTWAVLAVARDTLVGVDVECGKQTRDLMGIAANYYHPEEVEHLKTLAVAEQTEHFYRLWTLKEALLKATGAGISAGLDHLNFRLGGEITVDLSSTLPTAFFANKWQFHQWQLPDHSFCALAHARQERSTPIPENTPKIFWFDAVDSAL